MHGSADPEDRFSPLNAGDSIASANQPANAAVNREQSRDRSISDGSRALEETELDSTLQLLVERAQYITGATGTALALPQGDEMVCRASAGSSAPAVGARLQVRSGLTGESISRRQLLRCDNAETDPRVNLEACRALGIASIVVLPLLRRNGEVRGLFQLFSDHPYAFEERDLVALERMADLTLTALDLAEQSPKSASAPRREPGRPVESRAASSARPGPAIPVTVPLEPEFADRDFSNSDFSNSDFVNPEFAEPIAVSAEPRVNPQPGFASVPEAMLRVQKCGSCGFPVSEGRTLCLDCEKLDCEKKESEKPRQFAKQNIGQREQEKDTPTDSGGDSSTSTPEEFVPAFLANSPPAQESWLANHVNVLAIVVLILGIVVAVVVFR